MPANTWTTYRTFHKPTGEHHQSGPFSNRYNFNASLHAASARQNKLGEKSQCHGLNFKSSNDSKPGTWTASTPMIQLNSAAYEALIQNFCNFKSSRGPQLLAYPSYS